LKILKRKKYLGNLTISQAWSIFVLLWKWRFGCSLNEARIFIHLYLWS